MSRADESHMYVLQDANNLLRRVSIVCSESSTIYRELDLGGIICLSFGLVLVLFD